MICPKCLSEIKDGSIYCNKCGEKINENEIKVTVDDETEETKVMSNSKKLNKKKVIIGLSISIVMLFSGICIYEYLNIRNFSGIVKEANSKFDAGNYDDAIQLYNKALTYKKDANVEKELATAENYKQYQNTYNDGLKLIGDKKYTEAIQKLGEINQSASQIYNNAQDKITECKKNIINYDIQTSNNAINKGDYDTANKYIDDILKIDANNSDAKQLKSTIDQAQQKAKEQQKASNNPIIIKYSIDSNGYFMDSSYPNGSSIQLKLGQTIKLVATISPSSSERVLIDANVMESTGKGLIKTIAVGGGDINIIPNKYDWDKAYKYHIIVSN